MADETSYNRLSKEWMKEIGASPQQLEAIEERLVDLQKRLGTQRKFLWYFQILRMNIHHQSHMFTEIGLTDCICHGGRDLTCEWQQALDPEPTKATATTH